MIFPESVRYNLESVGTLPLLSESQHVYLKNNDFYLLIFGILIPRFS